MTTTNTTADATFMIPGTGGLADFWDRTSAWVSAHYVDLLIAMAAGLALYLFLELLRRFGRRLRDRSPDETTLSSVIGQALWKTKHWFMFMVAARLVVSFADSPPAIHDTVAFLFTITTVLQVAIWVREIILGFVLYRAQADEHSADTLGTAMTLIRISVTVAVFAIALIVVLDNLDVDVTGLVAGLGVGGIAIGLAAQGIFEELFAALSIIFDKPFKKGDMIAYDDTNAAVEKIGLKTTRLRSITGEEKIISNSNLLDKEISNMTRLEKRRIKFAIGLIYQTRPAEAERVPDVLREIVEGLGHKYVRAGFVGFGDSSINFEIEFEILNPSWDVVYQGRHEIGLAIYKRFGDEGFEFAYPTQTTFTASPEGEMIMPYPDAKMVATE